MHYDPRVEKQQPYDLLQQCTGPRPLAWLSSANVDGIADLSVIAHWQWLSPLSPALMFSAEQAADGQRATAVLNAEQTGWFVWNMATTALHESVKRCLSPSSASADAFQHAGVAKAPSIAAPCPRVAQSPMHLECRYLSTQRIPSSVQGRFVDVVLAEVARVHIKDELLGTQSEVNALNVQPLLHLFDEQFIGTESLNPAQTNEA